MPRDGFSELRKAIKKKIWIFWKFNRCYAIVFKRISYPRISWLKDRRIEGRGKEGVKKNIFKLILSFSFYSPLFETKNLNKIPTWACQNLFG